jgi:hypothetical protein
MITLERSDTDTSLHFTHLQVFFFFSAPDKTLQAQAKAGVSLDCRLPEVLIHVSWTHS